MSDHKLQNWCSSEVAPSGGNISTGGILFILLDLEMFSMFGLLLYLYIYIIISKQLTSIVHKHERIASVEITSILQSEMRWTCT